MSVKLDERIADIAKYWDEHKNDGGDLARRLELRERIIECFFELFAYISRDLQDLEGRPRESLGRKIWTPGAINISGDLRKFG